MNNSDNSTAQNFQLYELTTAGTSPVSLSEMKSYLGVTSSTSDVFLQTLIDASTEYGQGYTGREFTNNVYTLLIDSFEPQINIRRNPIDTITSIKYLVSGSLVLVDSSVYWLKKGRYLQVILLNENKDWPEDKDDREQSIEIIFVTKALDKIATAKRGIMQHVAFMFANRGDCDDESGVSSGANSIYDSIRIPRV